MLGRARNLPVEAELARMDAHVKAAAAGYVHDAAASLAVVSSFRINNDHDLSPFRHCCFQPVRVDPYCEVLALPVKFDRT
jgi:hypothetical protein